MEKERKTYKAKEEQKERERVTVLKPNNDYSHYEDHKVYIVTECTLCFIAFVL